MTKSFAVPAWIASPRQPDFPSSGRRADPVRQGRGRVGQRGAAGRMSSFIMMMRKTIAPR